MSLRTLLFWLHLLVGVTAGAVILFMSVTGVILAFEPQITDWLERDRRVITPPPDARPPSAEAILARAREARPDVRPTALTLRADPTASAVVSFGREGGALFVDQYRGVVLGGLSPVHDALHEVVEWHRWLGSRDNLRPVTGAANLGFLGLVVVGVYLSVAAPVDARGGEGRHPVPARPGRPRARLQLAQRDRHLVRARPPGPDAHRRRSRPTSGPTISSTRSPATSRRRRPPPPRPPARANDARARKRPRPGSRPRGSTRSGRAPSARSRAGSPSTPGCRSGPMGR